MWHGAAEKGFPCRRMDKSFFSVKVHMSPGTSTDKGSVVMASATTASSAKSSRYSSQSLPVKASYHCGMAAPACPVAVLAAGKVSVGSFFTLFLTTLDMLVPEVSSVDDPEDSDPEGSWVFWSFLR